MIAALMDPLSLGLIGCGVLTAGGIAALVRQGLDATDGELRAIERAEAATHRHATAQAELHSQLNAAKAVIRGLQNSLHQQIEIARVATDAGEALVHEHARLTDALIDACALLEGRPQQWRAVAERYGVPNGAPNIVDALRPRFLGECRQLIAEVQAATAPAPPQPRQPPVVIERALRVVAGRECHSGAALQDPSSPSPTLPLGA